MSGNQELLASVPLFEKLSRQTLDRLDRVMVERSYSTGAEIVREGDATAVGFFLIKSGGAEVRRGDVPVIDRVLRRGEFFGEMSLLDQHPRSATIAAVEDTVCLALTRWDFLAEVRSNPDMAIELLETLSLRLREAQARHDPTTTSG